MEELKWLTEQRKVSDLLPHPNNPRKMSEAQATKLRESLEKFNYVEIAAINLDNQILAGHQRLKIMQALGRSDEIIDVRVPNRLLTPQEADEYLIRSNLNTGDWDWPQMANLDHQILLTAGFTKVELKERLGLETDAENDDFDTDEEIKAITEPQTKYGDVYEIARSGNDLLLGFNHRLMCGDSTKEEDVKKLMGGGRR